MQANKILGRWRTFPFHFLLSVQQIGNNSSSSVRPDRRDREKKKIGRFSKRLGLLSHPVRFNTQYLISCELNEIKRYVHTFYAIDFLKRNNAHTMIKHKLCAKLLKALKLKSPNNFGYIILLPKIFNFKTKINQGLRNYLLLYRVMQSSGFFAGKHSPVLWWEETSKHLIRNGFRTTKLETTA